MGTKISIDIALFQERIDFLRKKINSMNREISTGETFEFTNVNPLIGNLENLIETLEMLEMYKSLFNEDVVTLEQMGESLQKQDETLAQSSAQVIHNPKGYTPLPT